MTPIQSVEMKIHGKFSIDKACKIKKYLDTNDKFKLSNEYQEVVLKHKDDFNKAIPFVGFVFFHLLIVKYYTDIECDLTYESFDKLMGSDVLPAVLDYIKGDYSLLLKICNLSMEESD